VANADFVFSRGLFYLQTKKQVKMTQTQEGWVVVAREHPNSERDYVMSSSFASTRSASIRSFVSGASKNWAYFKRKYNYRCERATLTIETKEP
jgi:hypothetical protein